MNWMSILQQVFETCIIPLLGLAIGYLIKFLEAKKEESTAKADSETSAKYNSMLLDTVITCLKATNQTYVNSLKEQGTFDKEAQKEAFNKTKTAVLEILTEDAKSYLSEAYGDLDQKINNLIESQISENK